MDLSLCHFVIHLQPITPAQVPALHPLSSVMTHPPSLIGCSALCCFIQMASMLPLAFNSPEAISLQLDKNVLSHCSNFLSSHIKQGQLKHVFPPGICLCYLFWQKIFPAHSPLFCPIFMVNCYFFIRIQGKYQVWKCT